MKSLILVAGGALIVLGGPVGIAQINPYRSAEKPPMTNEERQLLLDATKRLNQREHPTAGGTGTWNSSGSSGTARLDRIYRRQGMPCHAVSYEFTTKSQATRRIFKMNWCMDKDGSWKTIG